MQVQPAGLERRVSSYPHLSLGLPKAEPGTPQGRLPGPGVAAELGGVPPSPLPPASKPAAPRLHKTVASTRLCQGRSAGKGLARGGEGRLFSRPCNFPRGRAAGPPGEGRGLGPCRGAQRATRGQDGGGVGARVHPASSLFSSFAPTSFSLHFLSGRGRGRGRERRNQRRPGSLGLPGPRLAGGGRAGMRANPGLSLPLCTASGGTHGMSASKCPGSYLRVFFIHCYYC